MSWRGLCQLSTNELSGRCKYVCFWVQVIEIKEKNRRHFISPLYGGGVLLKRIGIQTHACLWNSLLGK